VPEKDKQVPHNTEEDAQKFAVKIQAAYDARKTGTAAKITQADEHMMAEINQLMDDHIDEFGPNDPMVNVNRKLKPFSMVDRGLGLTRVLDNAKQDAEKAGCTEVQYMNESDVFKMVTSQLNIMIKKSIMPLHSTMIAEYQQWLETPAGAKTRGKKNQPSTTRQKILNTNKLLNWVAGHKVGSRDEIEKTREYVIENIEAGTCPNGEEHEANTKWNIARAIQMFGKWMHETKRITDDNPYSGFNSMFPQNLSGKKETYPLDSVHRLLEYALTNPKYQKYIPALALSLFATVRPSEIGFSSDPLRRMNYADFMGFNNVGDRYNDYQVRVDVHPDRIDEDGNVPKGQRGTKIATDRAASLMPVGYEWIRYYWEDIRGEQIPTPKLSLPEYRVEWMYHIFCGSSKWNPTSLFSMAGVPHIRNGFRHTILTMLMRKHPDVSYWTERAGNSPKVLKKSYQNTHITDQEADLYFRMTPEYILTAAKQQSGNLISA
tara:strand:- start:903 stop:2369 length:1467 start_codon:yes stop_codon:yes gene_type:complete